MNSSQVQPEFARQAASKTAEEKTSRLMPIAVSRLKEVSDGAGKPEQEWKQKNYKRNEGREEEKTSSFSRLGKYKIKKSLEL